MEASRHHRRLNGKLFSGFPVSGVSTEINVHCSAFSVIPAMGSIYEAVRSFEYGLLTMKRLHHSGGWTSKEGSVET
jgi:hypothetical protein